MGKKKNKSIEFGNYSVEFCPNIILIFERFKQTNWSKKEAGGILLGEEDGNKIKVTKATVPTRFDKRFNFLYIRQKDVAQLIVDYEFYNSNKKTIYLGEWHTHAQDIPQPSSQDIKMLQEQFFNNTLNVPLIILVIKGRMKSYVGLFDGKKLYEGHLEV